MGWCSATEIIDAAIVAADDVVRQLRGECLPGAFDDELRPFVRALADKLRDADWDCVEESDHYDRFGPELRGLTDAEFRRYQAEIYADDPEGFAAWLVDVWAPQERDDVEDDRR